MRFSGPIIERLAKADLGGHRAVRFNDDGVNYADSSELGHKAGAIGITRGASDLGELAEVQVFGVLQEGGWNWTPGEWIYVGSSGLLTQVSPTSGWSQRIAIAETSTRIFVSPQKPIVKG